MTERANRVAYLGPIAELIWTQPKSVQRHAPAFLLVPIYRFNPCTPCPESAPVRRPDLLNDQKIGEKSRHSGAVAACAPRGSTIEVVDCTCDDLKCHPSPPYPPWS
jgi:hypothetical protein